eukprot:UN08105
MIWRRFGIILSITSFESHPEGNSAVLHSKPEMVDNLNQKDS